MMMSYYAECVSSWSGVNSSTAFLNILMSPRGPSGALHSAFKSTERPVHMRTGSSGGERSCQHFPLRPRGSGDFSCLGLFHTCSPDGGQVKAEMLHAPPQQQLPEGCYLRRLGLWKPQKSQIHHVLLHLLDMIHFPASEQ